MRRVGKIYEEVCARPGVRMDDDTNAYRPSWLNKPVLRALACCLLTLPCYFCRGFRSMFVI
jgi:hypothetical protein